MTVTQNAPPGVFATLRVTPRPVRYLLGGVLVNQLGAFVQAFLVLYLVHQGLSAGRAGICLGAYSLGAVLGALLGGELVARLGARNTIALSMACSALLVSAVPWVSHPSRFGALLVLVAVTGAVTQAYRPAAATMLSDLMPEQHIMAFSMLRIAMNVGAALSPLLAAGFILINWDLLFWCDGITALAYAVLALALLPAGVSRAPTADPHPEPSTEPTATGPTATEPAATGPTAARRGYGVLLHDTRFLVYLAAMLLSSMIYVQFMVALPLTLRAAGHPTGLYSAVLALSSTVLIACELKVTSYVRRWPATIAAGIGTALFALGLAGYGVAPASVVAVLASTVVFVTGVMVSGPTMFAHAAKAPPEVKGRYLGASQAMFGLGSALGPALGVLAWTQLGNGVWALCAVAGTIATVCAVAGVWTPGPEPEVLATESSLPAQT